MKKPLGPPHSLVTSKQGVMLHTVLNETEIFINAPTNRTHLLGQPHLDVANRARFVGEQSFDTDELPTAASPVLDVDHCRMRSATLDRDSG